MLKDFLGNISNGVKKHKNEIILGIIVFLLVLLSFSVGYIAANYQETKPIKFEETANSKQQTVCSLFSVLCFLNYESSNYRRRYKRTLSCLETF